MIDGRELMIGNLVNYEQTTHVVESLGPSHLTSSWAKDKTDFYEHSYNEISPIPLTPEILVKVGFCEIINTNYINNYQFTLQLIETRLEDGVINRDGTWFDGIGTLSGNSVVVNVICRGNYVRNYIETVHDLQNSYFVITGEHLQIEL